MKPRNNLDRPWMRAGALGALVCLPYLIWKAGDAYNVELVDYHR